MVRRKNREKEATNTFCPLLIITLTYSQKTPKCYLLSGLSVTPWTGTHQALLSMGFSRQEYWSWLPFLPKRIPILIANVILVFPVLKIYINEVLQFSFIASLLWLKIIFNISFIPVWVEIIHFHYGIPFIL